MAQVYQRLQQDDQADRALRRYLVLAPNGQHAVAAEEQLRRLSSTAPSQPPAAPHSPREPLPSQQPRPRDARREWLAGQFRLAQDLERQGRYLEARRAFGAVLTVEPNFEAEGEVYEHMAWCSLGLEPPEYAHAAAYLRAAAKAYQRLDRPDDAQRCLIMAEERAEQAADTAAAAASPPPGPPPPPVLPEAEPTRDAAGEGEH